MGDRTNYLDNMTALVERIANITRPLLDSECSEKDRAVALLLKNVGGSLMDSASNGRPVGFLPYRVKQLLDILEAELGRRTDLEKDT